MSTSIPPKLAAQREDPTSSAGLETVVVEDLDGSWSRLEKPLHKFTPIKFGIDAPAALVDAWNGSAAGHSKKPTFGQVGVIPDAPASSSEAFSMGWYESGAKVTSERRRRIRNAARERRRLASLSSGDRQRPGSGPALAPQGVAGPLGAGQAAVLLSSAAAAAGFDFPEESVALRSRRAGDGTSPGASSEAPAPAGPSTVTGAVWQRLQPQDASWARDHERSTALAAAAAAQALASQGAGRPFERSAGESLGSVWRAATGGSGNNGGGATGGAGAGSAGHQSSASGRGGGGH